MMEAVRYSFQEQDYGNGGKKYYPTAAASLYKGYVENILYGFPADILKFVAYDTLSDGTKDLSPITGAWYGALSTAMAQCVTTPLDVVRNRIMAEVEEPTIDNNYDSDAESNTMNYKDRLVKIAREEGVAALFENRQGNVVGRVAICRVRRDQAEGDGTVFEEIVYIIYL